MDARVEAALARVVADLRADLGETLLGILLAGSYAYGTALRRSDLDLCAVIREPWRQRRALMRDDIPVEVVVSSPEQIRRELAGLDGGATITMFARGRVLYDPLGAVAALVHEARVAAEAGPPALLPDAVDRLRYAVTDLLDDALDLADATDDAAVSPWADSAATEYLVLMTLRAALDGYYRLRRRWPPKAKYLLASLDELDPPLAILVRSLLSRAVPLASLGARLALLTEVVEHVLGPVGGPLRGLTSEREQVADGARAERARSDSSP